MKHTKKILIPLTTLIALFAVFDRRPPTWTKEHPGMTRKEANNIINQKGVTTGNRPIVLADGKQHTTNTLFIYKGFFPVWVLRLDFLDHHLETVRSGLNFGNITKVEHD